MRTMKDQIKEIQKADKEELMTIAKNYGAPYDLVKYVWENGKLPVVNFAGWVELQLLLMQL